MKTVTVLMIALTFAFTATAADGLTEKLQQGLFEEEANRNLDAAIKAYESVVKQADEQRKLVATALFRLGECYRKLGRTNEANAQYQRVIRDLSEQEPLVKLSRSFVGGLDDSGPAGQDAALTDELKKRAASLRVELAIQEAQRQRLDGMLPNELLKSDQFASDAALNELLRQRREFERKFTELNSEGKGSEHPDVKSALATSNTIEEQIRAESKPIWGRSASAYAPWRLNCGRLNHRFPLPLVLPQRVSPHSKRSRMPNR